MVPFPSMARDDAAIESLVEESVLQVGAVLRTMDNDVSRSMNPHQMAVELALPTCCFSDLPASSAEAIELGHFFVAIAQAMRFPSDGSVIRNLICTTSWYFRRSEDSLNAE